MPDQIEMKTNDVYWDIFFFSFGRQKEMKEDDCTNNLKSFAKYIMN